jgi:hypothetical protein
MSSKQELADRVIQLELADRVIQLELANKELQDKITELTPTEFIEQVFVVNGNDFKVSRIERMKDLNEQWKKSLVFDDDLVVLLKKV